MVARVSRRNPTHELAQLPLRQRSRARAGGQTQFHRQTIIEREVSPWEVATFRRENASVPGPRTLTPILMGTQQVLESATRFVDVPPTEAGKPNAARE